MTPYPSMSHSGRSKFEVSPIDTNFHCLCFVETADIGSIGPYPLFSRTCSPSAYESSLKESIAIKNSRWKHEYAWTSCKFVNILFLNVFRKRYSRRAAFCMYSYLLGMLLRVCMLCILLLSFVHNYISAQGGSVVFFVSSVNDLWARALNPCEPLSFHYSFNSWITSVLTCIIIFWTVYLNLVLKYIGRPCNSFVTS